MNNARPGHVYGLLYSIYDYHLKTKNNFLSESLYTMLSYEHHHHDPMNHTVQY